MRVFFIPWGHVNHHAQIWAFVTSISHMGEMRASDWSRQNVLRSDWLLPSVALITTTGASYRPLIKRDFVIPFRAFAFVPGAERGRGNLGAQEREGCANFPFPFPIGIRAQPPSHGPLCFITSPSLSPVC